MLRSASRSPHSPYCLRQLRDGIADRLGQQGGRLPDGGFNLPGGEALGLTVDRVNRSGGQRGLKGRGEHFPLGEGAAHTAVKQEFFPLFHAVGGEPVVEKGDVQHAQTIAGAQLVKGHPLADAVLADPRGDGRAHNTPPEGRLRRWNRGGSSPRRRVDRNTAKRRPCRRQASGNSLARLGPTPFKLSISVSNNDAMRLPPCPSVGRSRGLSPDPLRRGKKTGRPVSRPVACDLQKQPHPPRYSTETMK